MSIADVPVADQITHASGRKVRRYMNESRYPYRAALPEGVAENSIRRFMCECGHLKCSELLALRLVDFDSRSRPLAVVARHHKVHPDPLPPNDPKPPAPDPDPQPPV